MGRYAGQHPRRGLAHAGRPAAPDQVVVGADAARGHDDRLGAQREVGRPRPASWRHRGPRRSARAPRRRRRRRRPSVTLSPVTRCRKRSSTRPRSASLAHPAYERLEDSRPGAPGHVEARHRVAVPAGEVAAALGPLHQREEPEALRVQPGSLLTRREVDVRLGPLPGPEVLVAVEAGRAHPVLQGQLVRVAHPQPSLLRAVDEEQAAEGPERLAAQRGRGLLVDHDHPAAGVGRARPPPPGPASPAPTTMTSASRAMTSTLRPAVVPGRATREDRPMPLGIVCSAEPAAIPGAAGDG